MSHIYRVGELYHPNRTQWEEGAEYNFRSNVHEIRLFFRHPRPIERRSITHGEATFGLFVQDDVLLLVFKFGAMPWSDAPYTWHRVPQHERTLPPSSHEGRALITTFLVNADTGILLAIRQVSLSEEFTTALHQAILEQSKRPFDQVRFDRQLRQIYSQYQSKELFDLTRVRCKGGD